jgi:hypothetical protein
MNNFRAVLDVFTSKIGSLDADSLCRDHCERRVGGNRIENPIENDAMPPGEVSGLFRESNVAVQTEAPRRSRFSITQKIARKPREAVSG